MSTFKKSAIVAALGLSASMTAMSAHAVAVNNGDQLTINLSTAALGTDGNGASYFGMDTNGDGIFAPSELTRLKPAVNGGQVGPTGIVGGIIIGGTTSGGASHSGAPTAGDGNAIDKPWNFFANTGSDFLVSGVTGSTTAGLDMSGWRVTWNGIPSINMGTGAAASFAWDGVYGHAYQLNYFASVPAGDPSGFGGVAYKLHLEGVVVQAVPEASTYGMMLAGLGLVGFAARRRKQG